jgi:G3E family GTPase
LHWKSSFCVGCKKKGFLHIFSDSIRKEFTNFLLSKRDISLMKLEWKVLLYFVRKFTLSHFHNAIHKCEWRRTSTSIRIREFVMIQNEYICVLRSNSDRRSLSHWQRITQKPRMNLNSNSMVWQQQTSLSRKWNFLNNCTWREIICMSSGV